jgi:hypothetical protein
MAMYLNSHMLFLQQGNMFAAIACFMMCLSITTTLAYYYIVDHPKLANFPGWLMFLCICIVVNAFSGWLWVKNLEIGCSLGFGIANGLLSIPAYIIFSLLCKWHSHHCAKVPI